MPRYEKLFLSRAFDVKYFKVSRKDHELYFFNFMSKISALNWVAVNYGVNASAEKGLL